MSVKKSETALAERLEEKITWNQIFASGSSIFNLCICIFLCSAGWMDLFRV